MLKLIRSGEREILKAATLPTGHYFIGIPHGFQILDDLPQWAGCEGECGYDGETAYTVLMSPGQHLRTEIMIIYSGVDGDLKMLQKGSIPFSNDEDLRWIEKILNNHWEGLAVQREATRLALEEARTKPVTKLTEVPDAKWEEMASLVKQDPKAALRSILAALG